MLSRRQFLRTAGLTGAATMVATKAGKAFAQTPTGEIPWGNFSELSQLSWNDVYGTPPLFGRVGQGVVCEDVYGAPRAGLKVFRGPSTNSGIIRKVCRHYVLPIYGAVQGEPYDARSWSPIWYYIGPNAAGEDEYIHSAFVIPTREIFQEPLTVSNDEWFWAEVTVPIAFQFETPDFRYPYDYDYYINYYGQVHKVIGSAIDAAGNSWYKIWDDIEEDRDAWVLAKTMRRIDESEFAPIHPEVEDKVIRIDLPNQALIALENGSPVFHTRIASGTVYNTPDGKPIDFSTPFGAYDIQGKRPSRRMRGGEQFNLAYDVNAVPWVTYFTFTGAAIHGAYWHNNFGVPRSHGCINVMPDAARWIYRWSAPYVDYDFVSRLIDVNEISHEAPTIVEVI